MCANSTNCPSPSQCCGPAVLERGPVSRSAAWRPNYAKSGRRAPQPHPPVVHLLIVAASCCQNSLALVCEPPQLLPASCPAQHSKQGVRAVTQSRQQCMSARHGMHCQAAAVAVDTTSVLTRQQSQVAACETAVSTCVLASPASPCLSTQPEEPGMHPGWLTASHSWQHCSKQSTCKL